jgi:N-acetylglucosaminyldiphosphoundecaprenol N-acetyl-beta-D-mannosaminyltransferase
MTRAAGRHSVLGIEVNAIDYGTVVARVLAAAEAGRACSVSALAVHGVMTGHQDPMQRVRLNRLDMLVPDGQPVRWALNLLHRAGLRERVYGPTLMLKLCDAAAARGMPVYLYGSSNPVLERLCTALERQFPALRVVGAEPSRFRQISAEEKAGVVARVHESGARIVFVGLGCPRQEVWAYEYREALALPIIAVGAAFDFHAGTVTQAPGWMQARGLEWLYRLGVEPRRLWRRYLLLNPWYVALVAQQWLRLRRFTYGQELEPPELSWG